MFYVCADRRIRLVSTPPASLNKLRPENDPVAQSVVQAVFGRAFALTLSCKQELQHSTSSSPSSHSKLQLPTTNTNIFSSGRRDIYTSSSFIVHVLYANHAPYPLNPLPKPRKGGVHVYTMA